MEFLVLNKSVSPPKLSKLNAASLEEASNLLIAKGITDFSLYSNISDGILADLLSNIMSVNERLTKLENTITNSEIPQDTTAKTVKNEVGLGKETQSVKLQLKSKLLIVANPNMQIYESILEFRLLVENISEKSIRATKGNLIFSDLFGTDIFSVGVTINEPICIGGSIFWSGSMPYNEFIPEHASFAGFKIGDLAIRLADEQVIFNDQMEFA